MKVVTLLPAFAALGLYFSLAFASTSEKALKCDTIMSSCHSCSHQEVEKYSNECSETHYIEIVKCEDLTIIARSCNFEVVVKSNTFWKFEGSMFVLTLVSIAFVMARMRKLNEEHTDKINKQLSSI